LFVLTDNVEVAALPDTVTGFGLKLPELRCGSPLTLRLTFPAKLFWGVMTTEYVELPPLATVREEGVAEMEKLAEGGGFNGFTTNVTEVEWTREPLVPMIVMV